MPFDPNFPPHGAEMVSAEFRAQFNALHDEITTIPQGPPGTPGADGGQGIQGETGAQGEVSRSDLDDAIAGTARNPTGLPPLNTPYSDPASEELRVAYNALLTVLFRAP